MALESGENKKTELLHQTGVRGVTDLSIIILGFYTSFYKFCTKK